MRLSILSLVVLMIASGCSTSESIARSDEQRQRDWLASQGRAVPNDPAAALTERQVRADSLLALPPASLTAQDLQWLQVYYQSREQDNREAQTAEVRQTRRSAEGWIIGSLVVSAIVTVVSIAYLATIDTSP